MLQCKTPSGVPIVSITTEYRDFPAVMDTGCSVSLIEHKLAKNLNRNYASIGDYSLTCANTDKLKPIGKTQVTLQLGSKTISQFFYVVEKLPYPCILGSDFIADNNIILDLNSKRFCFGNSPESIQIEQINEHTGKLNLGLAMFANTECEVGSLESRIELLLQKYPTVARTDGSYGRTDWTYHVIDAHGPPPCQKPYRKSPMLREIINNNVKELLENGMIRPSRSPYAAPVVLDMKKNGKYRMCINYSRLNDQTKNNAAPMENVSTILRQLPIGYYDSLIDLKSGFWQIMLSQDSIEKSAFVTQDGHFEFLVMGFGLKNAPKSFAALMRKVLDGYLDDFVKVFMDDIIIYSKTLDEHLRHIELILKRLRMANLAINRDKSVFAKREVTFLGHIVSEDGLKKVPNKVQAISEFPQPKCIKDVQRFHGMCQWYGNFIEHFAEIAEPMTRLLKKTVPWHWGKEQQKSFEKLKAEMCNKVLLYGINYAYPILLKSDASEYGLGGALINIIEGIERPVMFISKTLNESERRTHIYEKELYAIIWGYDKLREFIEGHEFTIQTDNEAVSYLKKMKEKKAKLMRWANEIQSWNAKLVFRPGKENVEADALSRAPIPEQEGDPTMNDDPPDFHYVPSSLVALLTFNTPTLEKLKAEQLQDGELANIMKVITDPDSASAQAYQNYEIKDGLLMKKVQGFRKDKENTCEPRPVPVMPKSLVPEILYIFHDAPEAAHPGMKVTKRVIKSRYFWSGMNKEINDYVHSCSNCQKVKASNSMPYGLLQSVDPPSSVFERISVDFMGPFPASGKGRQNRFLFVVQDELSKWVELFPMRAATAKRVVDCLVNHVFCRYGSPKSILSDNGSQFTSKIMKRMCKDWKIKHYFTSPYHPQPNQTERVNRNLKAMLQAYAHENHHSWDEHLQKFALAMRVHVHGTTKVTPALLNLGREIPLPIDRNMQERETETPEELVEKLTQVPEKLKEIISWVKDNILQTQEKNKKLYDKGHVQARYNVGDLVLVKNHVISSKDDGIMQKLANRYDGPYLIAKEITPVTFHLHTIPDKKFLGKRHVADLKPFVQRQTQAYKPLVSPHQSEVEVQLSTQKTVNTVKRSLRHTPRVNYRTLAGYKARAKPQ